MNKTALLGLLLVCFLCFACGTTQVKQSSTLTLQLPERTDLVQPRTHVITLEHTGQTLHTAMRNKQTISLVDELPEQMDGSRNIFLQLIHESDNYSIYRYSWNSHDNYDSSAILFIPDQGPAKLIHEQAQDCGARHGQNSGWILDSVYELVNKDGVATLKITATKTIITDGKEESKATIEHIVIPQ